MTDGLSQIIQIGNSAIVIHDWAHEVNNHHTAKRLFTDCELLITQLRYDDNNNNPSWAMLQFFSAQPPTSN